MTTKDYTLLAKIIGRNWVWMRCSDEFETFVNDLTNELLRDNEQFDHKKFTQEINHYAR